MDVGYKASDPGEKPISNRLLPGFKASQWSFSISLLYYTVKLDLSCSSCNFTERNNLTSVSNANIIFS